MLDAGKASLPNYGENLILVSHESHRERDSKNSVSFANANFLCLFTG